MGVPGSQIDGTYEVFAPNSGLYLDSTNYFMIKLAPLDIGQYSTRNYEQSGGIFTMYAPNVFRLLFNYDDTMGKLLGFSYVGETYAVTQYASEITNKMSYQPDISSSVALDSTSSGNAIILSGTNYILMNCQELQVIESFGNIGIIKNSFAKIMFVGNPGKTCFNTFVQTPKIYYDPIQALSQLTLSFYSPDGQLYDFNGLDHSFTLELITLDEFPNGTHVNTHTGKRI